MSELGSMHVYVSLGDRRRVARRQKGESVEDIVLNKKIDIITKDFDAISPRRVRGCGSCGDSASLFGRPIGIIGRECDGLQDVKGYEDEKGKGQLHCIGFGVRKRVSE